MKQVDKKKVTIKFFFARFILFILKETIFSLQILKKHIFQFVEYIHDDSTLVSAIMLRVEYKRSFGKFQALFYQQWHSGTT